MLRAVVVVALALGAADAARPLGGAPAPAPTSPTVLGLCDCAFEAYGGCVLGDSTLPKPRTRSNLTRRRPFPTRPGAPVSARGPPGTRGFPLFRPPELG